MPRSCFIYSLLISFLVNKLIYFYHEINRHNLPLGSCFGSELSQTIPSHRYLHPIHRLRRYRSLWILYFLIICQVCRNVRSSSRTYLGLQHPSRNRCLIAKDQRSPFPRWRWTNRFHSKMDSERQIHFGMGHETKRCRKYFPYLVSLLRLWDFGRHHIRLNKQHDCPFTSQRWNQRY